MTLENLRKRLLFPTTGEEEKKIIEAKIARKLLLPKYANLKEEVKPSEEATMALKTPSKSVGKTKLEVKKQ